MQLRKILPIILFASIFFTPELLFAQELSTSTDAARAKEDEFKIILEEKRKEASESYKLKKVVLEKSLQAIVSEKKRNQVMQIIDKMANLNYRRTEKLANSLEKLRTLVDRIELKTAKANSRGIETILVERTLTEADAGIQTAQSAVASQSAKIYSIEVINQESLKTNLGKSVAQLQSDLKAVKLLVLEAKKQVALVVKEATQAGIIVKKVKSPTP